MPLSGWEGGKQRNECKWRTNGAGYLATLGVTKCPSLAASLSQTPSKSGFEKGTRPRSPSAWVSGATLLWQLAVPRRRAALTLIDSSAARGSPIAEDVGVAVRMGWYPMYTKVYFRYSSKTLGKIHPRSRISPDTSCFFVHCCPFHPRTAGGQV